MGRYSDQWDWDECEWCRIRGSWRSRPCVVQRDRYYDAATFRAKWQACERVRRENAAKREKKTLPRAHRRAVMAAAATVEEGKGGEAGPSFWVRKGMGVVDEEGGIGEGPTQVGVSGEMDNETGTEKEEASPLPAGSTSTSKPKHHHEVDAKKPQQRQAKSCTGPKGTIDEGVSLASDDDGDVARIHAANRKAWPRGQEPISAEATAEDREIAELVRRGFIGAEALRVDHDDDFAGDVCPYTVRFVEARKKGRKGRNCRGQGVQAARHAPLEAESDWWYLDDEAYAQLLSDEGAELVDWSEASSFVHVE